MGNSCREEIGINRFPLFLRKQEKIIQTVNSYCAFCLMLYDTTKYNIVKTNLLLNNYNKFVIIQKGEDCTISPKREIERAIRCLKDYRERNQ